MTSQEKDKFICGKLGLVWHKEMDDEDYLYPQCHCGYESKSLLYFEEHCNEFNPDFTSEAGRVQLLKLIVKKYGWVKLVQHYENAVTLLVDIADDTGRFRDEVFRWLEVRNEKGRNSR